MTNPNVAAVIEKLEAWAASDWTTDLYIGEVPLGETCTQAAALIRSLAERNAELVEGLRNLATVPIVVRMLGTKHTEGCSCPMCRACALIASEER